jgi:hypothetical protein
LHGPLPLADPVTDRPAPTMADVVNADSLVCFSAVDYRHVPLNGREACIYDMAYRRALAGGNS